MNKMYETRKQTFSEAYWDFIDVNANLERAEYVARRLNNGLQSGMNFFVMVVLFVFALGLAWHFDFHSTYDALAGLREQIIPGLPKWAAASAAILTAVITVAPTLMEVFASNLARANIAVIKLTVVGFSAFDVITDIPTTKVWIDSFQKSFNDLGPILGWITYWLAFFGWLAMATIGFQILVVVFGYLVLVYFKKMTVGGVTSNPMPFKPNQGASIPKQAQAQAAYQQSQPKQPKQPQTPQATVINVVDE